MKSVAPARPKPLPIVSRKWVLTSLVILVGVLVAFAFADETITRTLTAWPRNIRRFFKWYTRWGEADWNLIPALLVWLTAVIVVRFPIGYMWRWAVRALGRIGLIILVGAALPGLTAALLKRLIGRARPPHLDELGTLGFEPFSWVDASFQSFPSGHATSAFAFATVLVAVFGRRVAVIAYIYAVLIAISRIVVEAHYATDVIAAAYLGTFGAVYSLWRLKLHVGFSRTPGGWRLRWWGPIRRLWRRYFAAAR
jgi:membrane-associated phospholipid phosphatase